MTRTAGPPEQLVLDLGNRPALGAEDFLVSPANIKAIEAIDMWPQWPAPSLFVTGPVQAGKSHLVNVWRLKSGAESIAAGELDMSALATLEATGALAIEDIDRGIASEAALFHLLNLARERGHWLLLTSRAMPGTLDVALPDLASRLKAIPVVTIGEPDEALLAAVLVKLFFDRQLVVEPNVIAYIARHVDRSMEAASALVAAIDARSLARKRPITRMFAAEVLRELRPRIPISYDEEP
jgi:chromosomal replication initiation ATPase DnaA